MYGRINLWVRSFTLTFISSSQAALYQCVTPIVKVATIVITFPVFIRRCLCLMRRQISSSSALSLSLSRKRDRNRLLDPDDNRLMKYTTT